MEEPFALFEFFYLGFLALMLTRSVRKKITLENFVIFLYFIFLSFFATLAKLKQLYYYI